MADGDRQAPRRVRQAEASDAEALTLLAQGSSALAGEYRAIVPDLVITAEHIRRDHFYVCEAGGRIVGFYALITGEAGAELDLMFVADGARGVGVGRMLFGHMKETARHLGHGGVSLVSLPPAEGFYARMGAVRTGTRAPCGHVTWESPRMWLDLLT